MSIGSRWRRWRTRRAAQREWTLWCVRDYAECVEKWRAYEASRAAREDVPK